ncbi:unnamed protein product [Spirodela intermedia]|uniref:Uncharacterized protein n=1 Tax=Spirodela intermedia TaxID=51605 RepID=A0A7I8L956_SPIIN|nr:unnamed protein product [Spirodela intermedia]
MGGKRCSKPSSARFFFSIFFKLRLRRPGQRREAEEAEPMKRERVWISDEDRERWVGEPDIDWKATEFIARFYNRNRVADLESQILAVLS